MDKMPLDMEMPLNLGAVIAQYPAAMERYCNLPEEKRKIVAEQARNAKTCQEMRECIDKLLK